MWVFFFGTALVAAAVAWGAREIARELRASRVERVRGRAQHWVQIFAPGLDAVQADPRALLTWQGLALTARRIAAEDFVSLDRAGGGTFPFSKDQIQAAHARWTADWLSWELAHDTEFKLKALAAQQELARSESSEGSAVARARLDAVEHEKLATYQRRYEEYIRVAKALQSLI